MAVCSDTALFSPIVGGLRTRGAVQLPADQAAAGHGPGHPLHPLLLRGRVLLLWGVAARGCVAPPGRRTALPPAQRLEFLVRNVVASRWQTALQQVILLAKGSKIFAYLQSERKAYRIDGYKKMFPFFAYCTSP
jgi:hypothetical protein